jgi:4-amino-4-deoxychorismate lyase
MQVFWSEDQGQFASDRGLAYGDGLFETIRVNGEQPVLPDAHINRLCASAVRLGFELDQHLLAQTLQRACQRYCEKQGSWVLKMIVTRGSGGRGYTPPAVPSPRLFLSKHALPPLPDPAGVAVSSYPHPLVVDPLLAGLKTLNRLPQVLASQSIGPGCYETLMTNGSGHFLEGSRTNLIALDGDEWLTPPASDLAVEGIARQILLDYLTGDGVPGREVPVDLAVLEGSEFGGLLLINSVIGAVPARWIDGQRLPISDRLATIQSFMLDVVGT